MDERCKKQSLLCFVAVNKIPGNLDGDIFVNLMHFALLWLCLGQMYALLATASDDPVNFTPFSYSKLAKSCERRPKIDNKTSRRGKRGTRIDQEV